MPPSWQSEARANSKNTIAFDYRSANKFLYAFQQNTFQTFDDGPNKRRELARILHGPLKQHWHTLTALNEQGAGIYVMINEGNGKGGTKSNVIKIRAIFADFDGAPLPAKWLLEPHLIVESSPGKYHAYWLVADVSLEDFPLFQKALAKHYGSDPSVSDVCRVMRLPGFFHCKIERVIVRLLEYKTHPHYSRSELLEAMPFLQHPLDEVREFQKRVSQPRDSYLPSEVRLDKYVYTALENECNTLAMMSPNSGRNVQLNKSAFALGQLVGAGLLERHTVEDALLVAASDCGLMADDGESSVRTTTKSGLDAGIKEPRVMPDKRQSLGYSSGFRSNDSNRKISHTESDKAPFGVLGKGSIESRQSFG